MRIEVAKENIKEIQMNFADQMDSDDLTSLQIGIEALEQDIAERFMAFPYVLNPLPSETKE